MAPFAMPDVFLTASITVLHADENVYGEVFKSIFLALLSGGRLSFHMKVLHAWDYTHYRYGGTFILIVNCPNNHYKRRY